MGRLIVRITPADVGKRVSVRRWNDAGDGDGRLTDTVGILTSWDDGILCITRRTGELVRVAEATLVAGKVVPADTGRDGRQAVRRRGARASYEELARVAARAWQPVESERLGDWQLRAAAPPLPDGPSGDAGEAAHGAGGRRGFTRRANSVLPLGDPGLPLATALTRVSAWYARRGLPAYVQTATGAEGTQERLCAQLEAHGFSREVSAEVWTAPLAPIGDAGEAGAASPVRLSRTPDEGWLRRYHPSGAPDAPPGGPGAHVLAVLGAGPSVWFASVPDASSGARGMPLAIGRCVVDGRWAGFFAVEVAPAARRRGLATAVMASLARQALDEGASAAWLQVESENAGARALYGGMGFDAHHSYHHYRG